MNNNLTIAIFSVFVLFVLFSSLRAVTDTQQGTNNTPVIQPTTITPSVTPESISSPTPSLFPTATKMPAQIQPPRVRVNDGGEDD